MNISSKKITLLILAIASIIISRVSFMFVNDPEGPNLLIVVALAIVIFFVLLGIYGFFASFRKTK